MAMRRRNKSPVIAGLLIMGLILFGCCCGPFSLLTLSLRSDTQVARNDNRPSPPVEVPQPDIAKHSTVTQQRSTPEMPIRQHPPEVNSPIDLNHPAGPRSAVPSTVKRPQFPQVPAIEEPVPEVREWTSGEFKTSAEFVSLHDGVVTLRKQSGGAATLPLERLSAIDRQYIKHLIRVDRAAYVIVGKVISVVDGDTINVADEEANQHKIRLKGADAPELGQVFGDKAKEALEKLLLGKSLWVEWDHSSSDGMIRGRVYLEGEFINLRMVGEGFAWHVPVEDSSSRFENAARVAKANRLGLWINSDPAAPWAYREARHRVDQ